jgi:hypothetical protein
LEVEACKIVDEGRIEEQAIESIEYAAMAWENVGSVFCARASLECAFREVAENSNHRHDNGEWQDIFQWQFTKKPKVCECSHGESRNDSADYAFPRLAGAD